MNAQRPPVIQALFPSLRRRLAAVIAVAVLPPVAFALYAHANIQRWVHELHLQQANHLAAQVQSHQNHLLTSTEQYLGALAALYRQYPEPAACGRELAAQRLRYPQYANLGVISRQGHLVCSALPLEPGLYLGDRAYFKRAMAGGGFAIGEYQIGRVTKLASINLAMAIPGADGTEAVVYAALPLDWLPVLMQQAEPPDGTRWLLMDGQGMVLADNLEPAQRAGFPAVLARLPPGPVFHAQALADEDFLFTQRRLSLPNQASESGFLRLVVGFPAKTVYGESLRRLNWGLAGQVLVALACIALAFRLAEQRIALPVEQERHQAMHDPLTEIFNRRCFEVLAQLEMARAARGGQVLALIFIDVDRFKSINDEHGHESGDAVLRIVARRLSDGLRDGDILARLGGEEFIVLLPATATAQAAGLAERLRGAVAAEPVPLAAGPQAITVSCGVAGTDLPDARGLSLDSLILAADLAMYRAKAYGRNRVECATDLGEALAAQAPH